ncbi:hypothetical protein [Spirosoma horti]
MDILLQQGAKNAIRHTFNANPKLDKDLFIEEYKTLRTEIMQRISNLTNITGFVIAAWAAIGSKALDSSVANSTHQVDILLLYPIVAFLTSYSWAFNNTRIFQIGHYIRCREEDVVNSEWGLMYWECYIHSPESDTKLHKDHRSQGYILFLGTQLITLILALLIKKEAIYGNMVTIFGKDSVHKSLSQHAIIEIFFFSIGLVALFFTYSFIKKSQERIIIPLEKSR